MTKRGTLALRVPYANDRPEQGIENLEIVYLTHDHLFQIFAKIGVILVPVFWGDDREGHENAMSVYAGSFDVSIVTVVKATDRLADKRGEAPTGLQSLAHVGATSRAQSMAAECRMPERTAAQFQQQASIKTETCSPLPHRRSTP